MKGINATFSILSIAIIVLSFPLSSCDSKPDDTEIQQKVNDRLHGNNTFANINAAVKDGVVTLTGQCEGDSCASQAAQQINNVDGVDNVVNQVTVSQSGTDYTLRTSVQSVISKYKGVEADVANGVVVLRGNIDRSQLQPLMTELNSLSPKKIDNQLAIQ